MQTAPVLLPHRPTPPYPVDFLTIDDVTRGGSARHGLLNKLVDGLPEVYQPIFDHPEFSDRVRRKCNDRLAHILQIYQLLEAKLKRPIRVLDLGCAQGFFSLSLAKLGAVVHGIDYQYVNIAVCDALASEHPGMNVRFQTGRIEDIIARLEPGQYDLVLGLSIFHHTVHEIGTAAVQKMLAVLADKIIVGVFEMALATEPPHWASAQPKNPRQLLEGFAFVHEFALIGTHLSVIARPLYVASSRCWFLNGYAEFFDTWKMESHTLANGISHGTRRYFFGNGLVTKLFYLDDAERKETNLREHNNAFVFLQNPPANLKIAQLFLEGRHEREAWLVHEQLPGELLLDRIRAKKPYNEKAVLSDVLEQLAIMECAGLYHDDVRTWNVLIGADDRATLIDYGAISANGNDCAWPRNIFLSFTIFIHEVISNHVAKPDLLRSPWLNPDTLPEPYRRIMWEFLEVGPDRWSFALLRDMFLQDHEDGAGAPPSPPPSSELAGPRPGIALAFQAMEDVCSIYQGTANYWRRRATELESISRQLQDVLFDLMQGKKPS